MNMVEVALHLKSLSQPEAAGYNYKQFKRYAIKTFLTVAAA